MLFTITLHAHRKEPDPFKEEMARLVKDKIDSWDILIQEAQEKNNQVLVLVLFAQQKVWKDVYIYIRSNQVKEIAS